MEHGEYWKWSYIEEVFQRNREFIIHLHLKVLGFEHKGTRSTYVIICYAFSSSENNHKKLSRLVEITTE